MWCFASIVCGDRPGRRQAGPGRTVDPSIDPYDVTAHFGEPHVPQGHDLANGKGNGGRDHRSVEQIVNCRVRRGNPCPNPPVPRRGRRHAALAGDFSEPGRLIAAILDYDLPFIPVMTVTSPIRIGMCVPLSRSAPRAYGRKRHSPETEAVDVAPAEPGTLLPGGVPPTAPKR